MRLDDVLKAATARVDAVRVVRTAVNPLLWAVGIVTPISIVAAILCNGSWLGAAFFALACFPVVLMTVAYFWYMLRDPDRLQSEEYRLRQLGLQFLKTKNADAKVVDPDTQLPRLEDFLGGFGDGEEK